MAVLDSAKRAECAERFVRRYFVGLLKTSDLNSNEVRELIDDIDSWLDGAQAAANSAIRSSIRNKASASTRFAGLALVAMERAGFPF